METLSGIDPDLYKSEVRSRIQLVQRSREPRTLRNIWGWLRPQPLQNLRYWQEDISSRTELAELDRIMEEIVGEFTDPNNFQEFESDVNLSEAFVRDNILIQSGEKVWNIEDSLRIARCQVLTGDWFKGTTSEAILWCAYVSKE